jgi:regulatory protein
LTGQQTTRIPAPADRDYLALALRFLARSDKTVARTEQFLRARGADDRRCRSVIRELERRGYLNDQAFATRWAESRLSRRPMGQVRLKAELLRRGFSEMVADKAARGAYQGQTEEELASRALEGKMAAGRPLQRARFLRQRGFDDEIIHDVTQINLEAGSEES